MPADTPEPVGLLVKAHPDAFALRTPGGAASPLRSLLARRAGAATGLALSAGPSWHVAAPIPDGGNPWDQCHALLRNGLGLGLAGEQVAMAEPDFAWQMPIEESRNRGTDCAAADDQRADYPRGPSDAWFLRSEFSGLAEARARIRGTPRTRIAHLDTGYDPVHVTKPARLQTALARNFVDLDPSGAPSPDALDHKEPIFHPTYGHGTATLALLASEQYGGARGFPVVPLRVASFVVLLRNSAIAAALEYVLSLAGTPEQCDVLSMSMGGLASAAWADAVNALYEKGVVLVTAAGNNFGNKPVRSIVYPARFDRVLAATGVMADRRPYADLPDAQMAGCYGPAHKMESALSAWTPNAPWARIGCPDIVDQDGGGTSAATPQVAAAAALWLEYYRDRLGSAYAGWRRVEAVRAALFQSALLLPGEDGARLGRGTLRAAEALKLVPAAPESLVPSAPATTDFALVRLLSGLGVAQPVAPAARRMLELEALQLSQRSEAFAAAIGAADPQDPAIAPAQRRQALAALREMPDCSKALRSLIDASLPRLYATPAPADAGGGDGAAALGDGRGGGAKSGASPPASGPRAAAFAPSYPKPTARRLRIFAFDPAIASELKNRRIARTTISVQWEDGLLEGPVGEYVEVVDIDPASDCAYAPVDLNRPELLAQDGLEPSEGVPQFHQQMVYAVAMKTIGHFAQALGRKPFWADYLETPRADTNEPQDTAKRYFVRQLRIYPHGLRGQNAYYSPDRIALLFGYFRANAEDTGTVMRGGWVFSCLSHDIVAHETTHALLDGLHPYWKEPGHPDTPAFHEAFADLVALFQHFTMPEALRQKIDEARGNLRFADTMHELAQQFGRATGQGRALRDAAGSKAEGLAYDKVERDDPHKLGSVLVAAVFDAWLRIYEARASALIRLATGGTGVLPQGEIPALLADELATMAAKVAGYFLSICIRALDYCPAVEPTFGEYLRAIITADVDLVPDDPEGFRVALVDAFRQRGIKPDDVTTWSPEALVWQPPTDMQAFAVLNAYLSSLAGAWRLNGERLEAWKTAREHAAGLHKALNLGDQRKVSCNLLRELGLLLPPGNHKPWRPTDPEDGDVKPGQVSRIEVHSVRPGRKIGPDGDVAATVVVEITQKWRPLGATEDDDFVRGGCTLIWDRTSAVPKYIIRKRVGQAERIDAQQRALALALAEDGQLNSPYTGPDRHGEYFAMLHDGH